MSLVNLRRVATALTATLCGAILISTAAHAADATHLLSAFQRGLSYSNALDQLASSAAPDADRLRTLFEIDWANGMRQNPEFATSVGYPGYNDQWTDMSLDAIHQRQVQLHFPIRVLDTIRRDRLDAPDQLNYDLFRHNIEDAIEGTRFPGQYLAISQLGGVQQDPAQTLAIAPHRRVKDYEDIIARLTALPQLISQVEVLLGKGLETGVTPPRVTLKDVPQQLRDQMEPDPDRNPLLKPFREFPVEIGEADRERLKKEAATALRQKIIPAYQHLRDYLVSTYIPGARESIAMSDLPDGKAWYAFNVRTLTTSPLTPAQIHQIGLNEVKRIRVEMDKLIASTGFKGSFAEFSEFLRTDPRFYYTNREDLLCGYRCIAKRIDPELIRFFGKLPRLPYGVLPTPSYAERTAPTAYYQPGSPSAGRPGYFYANCYALDTRQRWEMEALTSHEAVPGHHLQISLAQEMTGLPEFRKHAGYTAFVEGWGLYAEGLSAEMGLYQDPYSKYGQLTYEMWRAIRLVVDTGIHSMGWRRQQAIDYFLANASRTPHDVEVEVDRYIVWPGQALAYKIGAMRIQQLRKYATTELGDKFDVREFHDQVLAHGALPLDVLDREIKAWVQSQKVKEVK
jgi:uncharacterized protein (DUF885 family)